MRVRTDFITNSSSASFILAFKDMPATEFKSTILTNISDRNLKGYNGYIEETSGELLTKELVAEIVSDYMINKKKYCLKLDDWYVTSIYGYNEGDRDEPSCLIYSVVDFIDAENLKLRSYE